MTKSSFKFSKVFNFQIEIRPRQYLKSILNTIKVSKYIYSNIGRYCTRTVVDKYYLNKSSTSRISV